MTISAEATSAKFAALAVECRRCLALGVDMKAPFIKDCLAQIEYASIVDLSGRTDIAVDNLNDARSAAEVVVIT